MSREFILMCPSTAPSSPETIPGTPTKPSRPISPVKPIVKPSVNPEIKD